MNQRMNRRSFLRGAGFALALPWLEGSMRRLHGQGASAAPPRRLVAINATLGIHTPFLFPKEEGANYTLTPYLEVLREHRNDLSVFSGLSHPQVDGGHSAEASFLTAAAHPGNPSFRNTISLDQFAAERLGEHTRFGFLALGTSRGSLSWTRGGIQIPSDQSPANVFARLFVAGGADEVRRQTQRLRDGQSILDTVRDEARGLERGLGNDDRQKLDEYFAAVRDLERRMTLAEEWTRRPKPQVNVPALRDVADRNDIVGKARLMVDLIHLALETDSTRFITLSIDGLNAVPAIEGVTIDHHNLSHHGQDPDKIEQLRIVEVKILETYRDLLGKLKRSREGDSTLLDRTMIFLGSNLGNASSHDNRNMPILLAGGGFRHGRHHAFSPANHPPLCNLFVSMLQRLGLETDRFGSSTGTLRGFDLA